MEKDKKEFDWGAVLTAFGFGFPVYCALAPEWYRKDLLEYTGKWIGFFFLLAVCRLVWGIIKDKRHK
jgi:cytochrome b